MKDKKQKLIIGWKEYVELPEWGIKGLKAKVDTGARTSAIHVEDVRELANNRLEFHVVLNEKSGRRKKVVARQLKKGRVRSSIGLRTHRWYVETEVMIGQIHRRIVVNLISRKGMNFRMLLGRRVLEDDFLVDVSHSCLLSQKPARKKKRK